MNTTQTEPITNKAQHSPQWFGAYDTQGKLRATFDSEAEAYFYVRNRGHMYGGIDRPIVNYADKLAALLKSARAELGRCKDHNCWKLCDDINTEIAAYEAAQ